jgi:thiamine biosynthesis lipoprotein
MKQIKILMGMPVTVEVLDPGVKEATLAEVFLYFKYVDDTFSTYKDESEIMKINRKELAEKDWSADMKTIFALSEKAKKDTDGYFDIMTPKGTYDPSGIVKGWAIWNASQILTKQGFRNFYVDAGGDVQTSGKNADGKKWRVGIKNPFNPKEIVKTVHASGEGVATSGTYIRGEHIYNPKTGLPARDIVSLTVVGPNIYEADLFATPAFAMGHDGINFIERQAGLEGYMIDKDGVATMTSGFELLCSPG